MYLCIGAAGLGVVVLVGGLYALSGRNTPKKMVANRAIIEPNHLPPVGDSVSAPPAGSVTANKRTKGGRSEGQSGTAAANSTGLGARTGNWVQEVIKKVEFGIVVVKNLDRSGQERGLGTGFVIDSSGLVATNFHVMEGATAAEVQFRDGTKIEVLGFRAFDRQADLAIIELANRPSMMQILSLRADDPEQGSDAVAIGYPSGFNFVTTTGIISAVHKGSDLPEGVRGWLKAPPENVWIQTSAPISRGNSGGPLMNNQGEVIGINTWVAQGQNLGFAVHIKHLVELKQRLNTSPLPIKGNSSPSQVAIEEDDTDPVVVAVLKEFKIKWEDFSLIVGQAKNVAERKRLEAKSPVPEYLGKLWKLAEEHRKTKTAYEALAWMCQMAKRAEGPAVRNLLKQAIDRVEEDHMAEKTIGLLAASLADTPHQPLVFDFLRHVVDKAASRDAKGLACLTLAVAMNHDDADGKREAEIVSLLERAIKEFGNVEVQGTNLASVAGPLLYEKQNLSVGKIAPEILGQDVDGKEFKLSDFRGKVVVIDFWADWCPYCRQMYPQERAMVEKHKDKPFVLVGVNCDEPARLRATQKEGKVTWRSWADGRSGPIQSQWNVRSYPTVYVLDQNGMIRHKDLRGDLLDGAVNELLTKPAK